MEAAVESTLEVISRPEQLPEYEANLCRPGGEIILRDDDQRKVALLHVGDKRVIMLWAGEPGDGKIREVAAARARMKGYNVISTQRATVDIVALCSVARKERSGDHDLEQSAALALFDELLTRAVAENASDLHINMMPEHCEVLMRVDGELQRARTLAKDQAESMCRAMYSQADVDSRKGTPNFNPRIYQDASVTRSLLVRERMTKVKCRWASGPAWPDAFDVVLRLNPTNAANAKRNLASLGFGHGLQQAVHDALKAPTGVIVLCGTTGSGKSTTLAAMGEIWVDRFNGRRVLRTIEDPPEYVIRGARHMPVSRSESGGGSQGDNGFRDALRAAMRQDPDALLVGEVRDGQTAVLLQETIQTGHKVFTTTHAGNPWAAISRLAMLGVERDQLYTEGFINAVLHQVLVPLVCQHCSEVREIASLPEDIRDDLATRVNDLKQLVRVRGPGCQHCRHGVNGRQVLVDLLMLDGFMRDALRRGAEHEAKAHWRAGKAAKFGQVQSCDATDQAVALVLEQRICPIDADLAVGSLARGAE